MPRFIFLLLIFSFPAQVLCQKAISRKQFFNDTTVLQITLHTDLKKLQIEKEKPRYSPAEISIKVDDSTGMVTEKARIRQRGKNRRETCGLAALMVDFSEKGTETRLSNLGEMKWVTPCFIGKESDQWLFREYLIYKMYNLFTEKSFKVRLLDITFRDSKGKKEDYNRYGFAIEPTKDLAKRNNCVEEVRKHNTESTDRQQMTLVAIFQYMVANPDWSVPVFHNIKLIKSIDSTAVHRPYVVPYDFDYAGAVNTSYSIPSELLPIKYVTDRYYMGFTRSLEEVNATLSLFRENEQKIMDLIKTFPLLSNYHRKEMEGFIKSFFKIISNEKDVKEIFVNRARTK